MAAETDPDDRPLDEAELERMRVASRRAVERAHEEVERMAEWIRSGRDPKTQPPQVRHASDAQAPGEAPPERLA